MNKVNKTYSFCFNSALPKMLCSFILTLLLSTGGFAQKKNNGGPSKLITQIPFTTFTGGVVVLRATIIGIPDTLNFIMDTGSGGISLDSTTCIRLNITPVLTDRYITGIGG